MENNENSRCCVICHSEVVKGQICEQCEGFIGQDHVYQRELAIDLNSIELFADSNLIGRTNNFVWSAPIKPPEIPSFNTLIRKAGVTKRQRPVLKLHFEDALSFFSIGKKLGISKDCAKGRYRGGLKKLKKYYPKLRWMRGKGKLNSPTLRRHPLKIKEFFHTEQYDNLVEKNSLPLLFLKP